MIKNDPHGFMTLTIKYLYLYLGSKYLSESLGTKKAGLKFGTFDDDDEDDDVYGVGPTPLRSMAIDTVLDDQPIARRRHDSDNKKSKVACPRWIWHYSCNAC